MTFLGNGPITKWAHHQTYDSNLESGLNNVNVEVLFLGVTHMLVINMLSRDSCAVSAFLAKNA